MFPRLRGAWGPMRRVAFAVVPAALGALLLLSGDRPGTGTSRLEVTQGKVPELLAGDPVPQTTVLTPSLSASKQPTTTTSIPTEAAVAAAGGTAVGSPDAPAGSGPVTTGAVATTVPATTATTSGAPSRDGPAATAESTSAPLASSGETTNRATTTTTSPPPPPQHEQEVRMTTTTTVVVRSGPVRTPSAESEVVPLTNRDRNAAGLGSLSRHSCLDAAASRYAEQLARSGTLAHNPGAGAAVTDCRPGAAWGDNVGTAGPCSAALLEEKWMASPTHRRNILTPGFQHIGVGAWTDDGGACWVQVLFSS